MKISINDKEVLVVNDLQKKVFEAFISRELLEDDLINRAMWIINKNRKNLQRKEGLKK